MALDFKLDHAGIRQLLKSNGVRSLVHQTAENLAARVDAGDAPVEVTDYTTDRAAASVTIKHARGLLLQARDGVLTRAAAGLGLEVTKR